VIYLDSSYIVKCYLREAGSVEVLRLVQESAGRSSGLHGRAEFYSAVHRRLRERHLTPRDAATVWKQFENDERAGLWHWLAVTENVVRRACNAFEKLDATIFLRASDALHLACAVENQFSEVYSSDQILLTAAPHFGLKGVNVY
jgi:predicted nucleic acid-binding protein